MEENPTKLTDPSPLARCKAYKSTEIDDYVTKPDSLSMETAVIRDFQFVREKELQSSGEEDGEKNSRGTKRSSRWLHLLESANSLEKLGLNPETPVTIDDSSVKSSSESDSSISTSDECDSSSTDSEGSESEEEEVSQASDVFIRKKMKTEEHLKTQDSAVDNHIEIDRSHLATVLVDVDLASTEIYHPENVPFVCLTSKFTGKAILGYPLEVGVINESSKTRNESVEGKQSDQLVWKPARRRRTPVSYVTNSVSSTTVGENGGLVKEQSSVKLVKDPNQLKQGKTDVSRTCVPVEVIFSKILAAVGRVQS